MSERYWPGPVVLEQHCETIVSINVEVNRSIEAGLDIDLFGRVEHWVKPVRFGDCEDFVLLKRWRLIEAGLPWERLYPAVGMTGQGGGHAVLLIDTDMGLQALDNLTDQILPWDNCQIVKWHSYADPSVPGIMWRRLIAM